MNKKQIVKINIFLVIIVLITNIFAQSTKTDIQPLPEGVSIYQLDNGMQVLLIENPALPMVGVNVVVKVGSAYESFKTSGMSHYLEHLLFNGSDIRTQKQLYDETDMIGGYNNANTSEYFTNYMMVMPSEHMKKGMELQADMLFNSNMPIEKFNKEKGIVLEEISKSLNNADSQANRNVISILYNKHALSLPTLGTYSTIEHMEREDVYNFYKTNYVPNNMILSAIGNFQSAEMLDLINEVYGMAKPGEVKRENNPEWATGFQPLINTQNSGKIFYRFFDGNQSKMQLFYKISSDFTNPFYDLLLDILAEKSDEIEKIVKEKFGDEIKSLEFSIKQSPLVNFIEVDVTLINVNKLNEIENIISSQLANLDLTITTEQIEIKVAKARTNFLKNIEKPHMFGIYNAYEFAVNGIESVLASYSGSDFFKASEELKKLKIDTKPIIIVQSPSSVKSDKIASAVKTKFYNDNSIGKNIIAVQNSASNLLAVHYLVKHKAMYESKYGKDAAKILHDIIGKRLKSEKNQKISAKYGLSIKVNDLAFLPMDDIYLHPDFGYIRVEGIADDIPGVISFLNSQLKNFMPTQEEFKKVAGKSKRSMPMMMGSGGDNAKMMFDKTYKSYIYEKSQYAEGSKLTYDNLVAFAKEYFQPGNMIISVVSPETPEKIEELFAGFKGKAINDEPLAENKKVKLQTTKVNFDKSGGGKRSFMFWGFVKEIEPKDKAALTALSLILKDQIVFDIREKRGMAYHMSTGINFYDDKALFYINQGTRPKNVDVLLPIYPNFFKVKNISEVTEKDLEKSINMYLGKMMFRRLSSINNAYYLAHSLYFHGDINYDHEFLEQLKNVKLNDVKKVAKKYMKVKNPVSVVVR